MSLTVLCVTKADEYAIPFLEELEELAADLDCGLVIAADGDKAARRLDGIHAEVLTVRSHGYLESVLDEAVAACPDGYILRLDDDERPSHEMYDWLLERRYETHDHWAFPRLNLWRDEDSYITSLGLYPDLQTRLSTKEKSGDRTKIHAGSPYGTGMVAPCPIEHHKFLIRSFSERKATVDRYERLQPGAGGLRFLAYSVPEYFDGKLTVAHREEARA